MPRTCLQPSLNTLPPPLRSHITTTNIITAAVAAATVTTTTTTTTTDAEAVGGGQELLRLKLYLLKIAALPDLRGLRHSQWERHARQELRTLESNDEGR